jgi:two-component system sensor histidine kinase YesM
MQIKIIKFILQPIVENSIIHAFEDRDGIGCITIKGKIEDENLILSVEDNGVGMTKVQIEKIYQKKNENVRNDRKVTGLGIKTIHEMLKIACGDQYGVEVRSLIDNGTQVRLILPLNNGEENTNV